MICRKLEVPNDMSLKSSNETIQLLDQHDRYVVGKNEIQVYRNDGFWRVSVNSVVWNIHIKGSDKVEHYETLTEAVFVAKLLDEKISKTSDIPHSAADLEECLRQFTISKL